MIKKLSSMKIRTKLALLIFITGILCFSLFHFLWYNKYTAFEALDPVFHFSPLHGDEDFFGQLYEEAAKYDLPKSEEDTEAVKKLQPWFDLGDAYTSIYVYGSDGYYRAGKYASAMNDSTFRTFFDLGYRITGGEGENAREFPAEFRNGSAQIRVYFYHNTMFLYPYVLFCLCVSFLLFLWVILCFISHKMRQISKIEHGVLQMASGDLKTALPKYPGDEIGILSSELNQLRVTLADTLQQEQESRQANQDLITALSHDLRTPLTILNGYLEVLHLKKSPEMEEEYLRRCLQKTKDIKDMTDRMFEYTLVYEEKETPDLEPLPYSFFYDCLKENADYIHLAGFSWEMTPAIAEENPEAPFTGDVTMLKRIFQNLFSNILKYGDKSAPVLIDVSYESGELRIRLKNKIKETDSPVQSTHIGLRSVEKMMTLLNGQILYSEQKQEFAIQLTFFADCTS